MSDQLHVVSVSLGSSTRDKDVTVELLGRRVRIERRGVDGDMKRAIAMIGELDGKVDAIGLGGIDRYLIAAGRKFEIRDARRMAEAAKITPVVDGSGLKHTLERSTINWLQNQGVIDFKGKRVLLVSAVDRFGMAETLPALGAIPHYGDLIFALGIPLTIKTLRGLKMLAWTLLPIICRLPFSVIYPTGSKQTKTVSKHGKFFEWADIIAGDFLFILRYMPERLDGKIILTNTTTEKDVEMMRQRGVKTLVNTTCDFDGRNFGTNANEAAIIALSGKRPEELTEQDFTEWIAKLGWTPRVVHLQAPAKVAD